MIFFAKYAISKIKNDQIAAEFILKRRIYSKCFLRKHQVIGKDDLALES